MIMHTSAYHAYVYSCLSLSFNPNKSAEENFIPITETLELIAAQLTSMESFFPDVMVVA